MLEKAITYVKFLQLQVKVRDDDDTYNDSSYPVCLICAFGYLLHGMVLSFI
jgi:hypothetical protein